MLSEFTVLAVDDDRTFLNSLGRILKLEPVQLLTSDEPRFVLSKLKTSNINLVLLDLRMPTFDGVSLLIEIKKNHPHLPVVILTGHGSVKEAVNTVKMGADDFLEKPCPPAALVQKIRYYREQWQKDDANVSESTALTALIGSSAAMNALKTSIRQVAKSDASILLFGETGTGKELVAQAIHRESARAKENFVPVDCATLGKEILESELFGHKQGAFTGAQSNRQGLFLEADGGTLFMDEIGEFPLDLQAKMLRSIQERQVRPVGDNKCYSVNIRLISATHRDLEQLATLGKFREDLYYRVATIVVEIPPLRERREDISLLAQHFLEKHAPSRTLNISPEVQDIFDNHSWPGNIRELENVMHRAATLCDTNTLSSRYLPAKLLTKSVTQTLSPTDNLLSQHEKTALQQTLEQSHGSRRMAAKILGISEATLYRKLKKFGLSDLRDA